MSDTIPSPVPARDRAIDELAKALGRDRVDVAALVDLLVLASSTEACARVNESLVDGLRSTTAKVYDLTEAMLFRASRELGGEHG